jgi:hypothetical protein
MLGATLMPACLPPLDGVGVGLLVGLAVGVGVLVAVLVGVTVAVEVAVAVGVPFAPAGVNVPEHVPLTCVPLIVTVHGTLLIAIGDVGTVAVEVAVDVPVVVAVAVVVTVAVVVLVVVEVEIGSMLPPHAPSGVGSAGSAGAAYGFEEIVSISVLNAFAEPIIWKLTVFAPVWSSEAGTVTT